MPGKYGADTPDYWRAIASHNVPKTSRRRVRHPLNIKPPRMSCCGNEPPACACPKEKKS